MSRIARAAKQFEREVKDLYPEAEMDVAGEPDGLGVHRSFKFDSDHSQQVWAAMDEITNDPRFEEIGYDDGVLWVVFTSRVIGDDTSPFHLADAQVIAQAQQPEEEPPAAEEPKKPARKAAKKAAKKST